MIREMMYAALVASPAVQTLLGVDGSVDANDLRVYPAGSLGVGPLPTDPQTPYAQYSISSSTPYQEVRETGGTLRHLVTFMYYDERGDFTRIDAIHKAVKDTVVSLEGRLDTDGWQCTSSLFTTIGADLTDNVRNLGVKVASFRLVGK